MRRPVALLFERKINNHSRYPGRRGIAHIDRLKPCTRGIKAALHIAECDFFAQFFASTSTRNPADAFFLL